jgi:periplasmic protein TonB
MPADLFRPNVAATPSRRRASLLPVSIALHAIASATFFIVPLLADVELPPPNQHVAAPYIAVMPITPPVVKRSMPPSAKPLPSVANVAPTVPPDSIAPERGVSIIGDPLPGSDVDLPDGVDPGLIPGEPAPPPPPPKPVTPARVRPGGLIEPPRKVRNVSPVYPAIAQSSRVQGTVILEAVIGVDGRVEHVKVLRPVMLLTESAIEAVRQWEFTPTRLNGEPVQVIMTVTVDFRLQ